VVWHTTRTEMIDEKVSSHSNDQPKSLETKIYNIRDFEMKVALIFTFFLASLICWVAMPCAVAAQEVVSTGSSEITNSIGMKLVPIAAGRFSMGSPASEPGSQEDEVLHKVELTQDFHLGATEVTEQQWAMVMEPAFMTEIKEVRDPETNRLVKKEEFQIRNPKLDSQRPVTGISWRQAVEFCERLGQLPEEKKEGRVYRLPTEAEWEYACRAGSSTAYSFGDDPMVLNDHAWHGGNRRNREPMPVAQLKPNAWGLYDMHGNVAEWCHDYYGVYPEDLVTDPIGPEKLNSLRRVIRGGSFESKASQYRSGWRGQVSPGSGQATIGLRVVWGTPLPVVEAESVVNSIGQRLVTIPAGRFMMGSDKGDGNEKPMHEVVISRSFWMASTEVTQGQWKAVMGTEPWKGKDYGTEGDSYPVTYVTWEEATEFCRRLSERPEEKSAGRVYRLPTEAEWEYACRGGLTTKYNFGDDERDLGDFAFFDRNVQGGSQMVGQKTQNAFGLYDMHGNVWEWCGDWYGDYPKGSVTDPRGPVSGSSRVYRGGSWFYGPWECRAADRFGDSPSLQGSYLGFRPVSVIQP
jgi:formylglycine-generating enzyme required for sulfatase activity